MYEKRTPLGKRCNLTFKFLAIRGKVKGKKTTKKGEKHEKTGKIIKFSVFSR